MLNVHMTCIPHTDAHIIKETAIRCCFTHMGYYSYGPELFFLKLTYVSFLARTDPVTPLLPPPSPNDAKRTN